MPRLFSFLKGRGHRLEFVVGVMKVTNGRKGDAPRRECTAPRPRRGPRGGEALAGVRRRARVRVQGAGRRDERADGLRGPADVRREPQRAQRRQGEQPQRLPPQVAQDRRGRRGARDTQAQARHLLPRGHARAMVARRHLGGRHRAGDVRVRRVHPQGRARGVQAGHILAVELGGLEPLLRPRRRGGGVPPPRPVGHAVLLPVARRHLHELQGRLVGRLAGRRDRDRAGRRRAQALPGLRRGRHRERGLLGGIPRRAARARAGRRSPRGLRQPRRARGRRLAPVPGLRLAALRDAPAAQPPERLLGHVSVNLFFTSFAKQAHRSRKGGFTGCANAFSPIPVTA